MNKGFGISDTISFNNNDQKLNNFSIYTCDRFEINPINEENAVGLNLENSNIQQKKETFKGKLN